MLIDAKIIKQDLCPCYLFGKVLHARGILKCGPHFRVESDRAKDSSQSAGWEGSLAPFQDLQGQNYVLFAFLVLSVSKIK